MRALDVVGSASKPYPASFSASSFVRLLHVQDRRVVELGERVDEQLPVALTSAR